MSLPASRTSSARGAKIRKTTRLSDSTSGDTNAGAAAPRPVPTPLPACALSRPSCTAAALTRPSAETHTIMAAIRVALVPFLLVFLMRSLREKKDGQSCSICLENETDLMIRKAFRMSVHPGGEHEYERRHNPIWPEFE